MRTGVYTILLTLLLEHIDRPLVSIVNLCIQGVGDRRYPNIPRVLSVRTEDLPAGLLHVGEPPLSFLGLTGSQYHRTCNASWPGRKLVAAARCGSRDLSTI